MALAMIVEVLASIVSGSDSLKPGREILLLHRNAIVAAEEEQMNRNEIHAVLQFLKHWPIALCQFKLNYFCK